jgi:GNAT superfamily N-acetyltransferase
MIGRLLRYIADSYNRISAFFWPDRAANPALLNVFARAKPFVVHHWTGIRARAWSLESLGVKPEYQGKGIGRELVRWGLEKARRDRVAASVVAAFGKERFYRACGFDDIAGNVCDGEGNPMAGFKGGALLFKDPVSVD